ncbi:MAG: glycosyltransferase, partial [Nakamurella multipartita]
MTLDVPVTVSVIVPTFNEAPNVAELVARVGSAVADRGADLSRVEIIFVDDSTDDTPRVIEQVARTAVLPVRMIHRTAPEGGLGGAVVEGMRTATGTWCVVMDGDLQHPPELIPVLVARGESSGADVVVASRYCGEGSADGLAGGVRRLVSS